MVETKNEGHTSLTFRTNRNPANRPVKQSARHSSWLHYTLAVSMTAATLLLYEALTFSYHDHPGSIVFLIPVVLSAYFGGLGPGLVSTVLSVLAGDYFLTPPLHSFHIAQPVHYVGLTSLLLIGVLISMLSESLHRAKKQSARNILARLHAGEILLESENRYRSLFENMLDGFAYCKMIFDDQGHPVDFIYLGVNAAFGLLTGLQNVTGKRVTEVIPGIREAHPELFETYGRVALTGQPERFELEFKPLELWLSISVYSPQREYVSIVFENITKRKMAEQALREDEEELAVVYDNVPLLMLLLDGDRHICKANRFTEQFTGASAEGLFGQRSGEGLRCLHALEDPRGCGYGPHCEGCMVRRTVLDTFATGHSHQQVEITLHLSIAGKTQEVVFLLSTAKLEVRGQPRVLVTLQDVTERKLAEDELRRQLCLMNCITDKSTDSIFLTDSEGRVTFLNPEAERVFGFTAAEMMGRVLHDMIHHHHPDGRNFPADECPAVRTFKTDETLRDHEEVYFRKDGSMLDVSRSTALLEVGGERLGVVYVLHDISERKQAARTKLRSQKLEALGTIAGGIAHDFNNILAAINGNTQFALSELQAGHSVQECLSEIAKAGARASDLVRRILSFTRPAEQKRTVQPLQPVVEEALRLVRATLPALVEIQADFAPDLPSVNVDSTQIHQVIVNLATNAAHAIGDKPGRIELRLDTLHVSLEDVSVSSKLREGRYVRLHVSDDGCGIPGRILERIFDPFFTTKPVGEGTGLGLSVVHGIVTSHDGAITVCSEPSKGTSFHLYFPASEQPVEQTQTPLQDTQLAHGEHVLYVDDEEALVFLGTRNLERLGYKVSGFTDAESALREFHLKPGAFDVVITDVSMPRLSGFEFARQLRAVRPEIPIVVTSGYVRAEDQAKAAHLGIRDIVSKPCTLADLTRALNRILEKRASAANPGSP
jgi:PAS domain S-box-containing protein